MKKNFLLLILISSAVLANKPNALETDIMPLGEDRHSILIKGNIVSNETDLRNRLIKEVKDVCGTRYEIESVELGNIAHNGSKKLTIQGKFKCYVNSQM